MPIQVLIVDDHSVVRQGLRIFLDMDPNIRIVGEATSGTSAVQMARDLRPDVVLMDLLMPGVDGITATRVIRRELPDVEVIALTSVLKNELVVQAVQAGAIGYLLKDTDAPKLRQAIHAAAAGEVQLSPEVAAMLLKEVRAPHEMEHLTDREMDVLRLVARGLANKEIGRELFISETTVKSHVKSIMDKLELPSRIHLALYAVRMGLASLDPKAPLLK